jgi:hypothetical protein
MIGRLAGVAASRGLIVPGRHWILGGQGGGVGSIEGVAKNWFGTTPYFLVIANINKQNV